MANTWVIDEALYICREIEAIAPDYGCHVALTGGLLYKDGPRKDADIVLYRIRDEETIDVAGLFRALREKLDITLKDVLDEVWCVKAFWKGKPIDFFFPEAEEGDYPPQEDDADDPEPLKCCPRASFGDGEHDIGCRGTGEVH